MILPVIEFEYFAAAIFGSEGIIFSPKYVIPFDQIFLTYINP
jgi:hypothetical protein